MENYEFNQGRDSDPTLPVRAGPARWGWVSMPDLYRAILEGTPYPVRAMIGFGANVLLAHANGRQGREALKALDFYAHLDLFMNPTAELADVVLPVASAFEREGLKLGFEISQEAQSLIQLRPAVVPPPCEARADTDIIFDLASRLGLAAEFWNGDIDAAYRHQLAPTGVTLEQLRAAPGGVKLPLQTRHVKHTEPDAKGAPRGFATPSRKVELYSQTFLDHRYAPLPEFSEPPVGPVARPDLTAISTQQNGPDHAQTSHENPDFHRCRPCDHIAHGLLRPVIRTVCRRPEDGRQEWRLHDRHVAMQPGRTLARPDECRHQSRRRSTSPP